MTYIDDNVVRQRCKNCHHTQRRKLLLTIGISGRYKDYQQYQHILAAMQCCNLFLANRDILPTETFMLIQFIQNLKF